MLVAEWIVLCYLKIDLLSRGSTEIQIARVESARKIEQHRIAI